MGYRPNKVGVLGFSAEAYLAADLAIGAKATRPDFVGLIYGGLRRPGQAVPRRPSSRVRRTTSTSRTIPCCSMRLGGAPGPRRRSTCTSMRAWLLDLRHKGTTSDHWFDEFLWWLESSGFVRRSGQ